MQIKTLKTCRYGNVEYRGDTVFDVPDGIAASMVMAGDAKLNKTTSSRRLLKQYARIDGKLKKTKEPKPAKPIKVKRSK